MTEWSHQQYDLLERAITSGRRIAAYRRGTEFVVVPTRLHVISGREALKVHRLIDALLEAGASGKTVRVKH